MNYSLNADGIFVPDSPVLHRDEEYDPCGFEVLRDMQARHFWYQGRHRFLLRAMESHLKQLPARKDGLRGIDLGGGCGGWLVYLQERLPGLFAEIALSDSSLKALEMAGPVLGKSVARYQTDLLRLGWQDRWERRFFAGRYGAHPR